MPRSPRGFRRFEGVSPACGFTSGLVSEDGTIHVAVGPHKVGTRAPGSTRLPDILQTTVAFGANTRAGHGGYAVDPLFSIVGGAAASYVQVVNGFLVPVGTYGQAPPGWVAGQSYDLDVLVGGAAGVWTIDVIANQAHVMSRATDTSTNFQLRDVINAGVVPNGGKIKVRDGAYFNPAGQLWTVTVPAGQVGGAYIDVEAESYLGAKIGGITIAAGSAGLVPLAFRNLHFYVDGVSSYANTAFRMLAYAAANTHGVSAYDCGFELGPACTSAVLLSVWGVMVRSFAVIDHCFFDNLFVGMDLGGPSQVNGSITVEYVDQPTITWNVGSRWHSDFMIGKPTRFVIEDNHGHSPVSLNGAHIDYFQYTGYDDAVAHPGGSLKRNTFARGDCTPASDLSDTQFMFYGANTNAGGVGASWFTAIECENNLYYGANDGNCLAFSNVRDISLKRNTCLAMPSPFVIAAKLYLNKMAGVDPAQVHGGAIEGNVQNIAASVTAEYSDTTVDTCSSTAHGHTLAHYQTLFSGYTGAKCVTRADVIAQYRSILGGPLEIDNTNHIYGGALFPDGSWNDGNAYVSGRLPPAT